MHEHAGEINSFSKILVVDMSCHTCLLQICVVMYGFVEIKLPAYGNV